MFASAASFPPLAGSRRVIGLAAVGLLSWALLLHAPYLAHLPEGIHAWAQADRLALALSYYDHGLQFLRPQTFNLQSIDGVVGVEFPLLAYLAALGGKLLGRAAVGPLLRLLVLGTTVLGGWYMFRLVYEQAGRVWLALVPAVFWLSAPVVAYYAGNYLPDAPAASLCLVGYYYYLRHAPYPRFADIGRATLWLLLATLLKTSAGVYLVAVVGGTILWAYLQPALLSLGKRVGLLGLLAGSLALVLAYTGHTHHLNALYQSDLFIAQPRPIESMAQLDGIWVRIRDLWAREYLTPLHYLVAAGALVWVLVLLVGKRDGAYRAWYAQVGLGLLGGLCFFALMGQQYLDHDYYIIAPFGPAVVLLVALACVQVAASPGLTSKRWSGGVAVGLLLGLAGWGGVRFWQRHQPVYLPFSTYYNHEWLRGGAEALRQAGIPRQATLLFMSDLQDPNTPLIYFDRRGYVWRQSALGTRLEDIEARMNLMGLSHLVLPRAIFEPWWAATPAAQRAFQPVVRQPAFVVLARRPALPHWP